MSTSSIRKRRPIAFAVLGIAALSVVVVVVGAATLMASLSSNESSTDSSTDSSTAKTTTKKKDNLIQRPGFVLSISLNNIIVWNPSPCPNDPTFAFQPDALRFLTSLLQSPQRPVVHLISTVINPTQTELILDLLRSNGLFSKGLDQRRVLFCDTVQGRVHLVKHLGSVVHVDDDDQVLIDLVPHVKKLIRVKRSVKVTVEADIRRMSQTSLRSKLSTSPTPSRPSSPLSSPTSLNRRRSASPIQIEDDEDEEDEGVGSIGSLNEDRDSFVSPITIPSTKTSSASTARPPSSTPTTPTTNTPTSASDKPSIYQNLMRSIHHQDLSTPQQLVVVNGSATPSSPTSISSVSSVSSNDGDYKKVSTPQPQAPLQNPILSVSMPTKSSASLLTRSVSQASFRGPSSYPMSNSKPSQLSLSSIKAPDVVPEALVHASNVEFVEDIAQSSLMP
ncbi:hypothetical protein HDU79_010395 [Rhizoclosmatium sp. JEL0117]|nr:hypothetical protein HDU79_010395 [Rhizoclosmatium sp. JEL0117]